MKTFLVVATKGILDSGLTIILDMLCTAGLLIERNHESQSFRIVTADRRKQIRAGAGLEFSCDYTFQHALQFRRYIFKFVIIVLLGMNLAACERTEQTYYIDSGNVIYSKDPSQTIEISIDGFKFSIPSGYLQSVGRWNNETLTFDGYFYFEMDAESLLPITKKSRKKIWGGVAPRNQRGQHRIVSSI